MSKIQTPYNLMLNSLSNIDGFKEFCVFLKKRINVNYDWRAEIKSLFEVNKAKHPLEKICSHFESEPEGIFKVKESHGIIEAAFIGYIFDRNYEKNKIINKVKNLLEPFRKKLVNKYENYLFLMLIVNEPTESELNKIKTYLNNFFIKNDDNLYLKSKFGILEVFQSTSLPSRNIPDVKIGFSFSKGTTFIQSFNVNLNKKIISLIKSKRNQHKLKYNNFIKIYYFYVNCPIPRLDEVDNYLIQKKLHDDEVLVLNAVGIVKEILEEYKKIFGKNKDLFDFSNPYFKPYKPYIGKSIKIPFGIF